MVFGTTEINAGLICSGPVAALIRIPVRKKLMEMVLAGQQGGPGTGTGFRDPGTGPETDRQ
jgi:enoyl-CoA hydratase/carnithine racemase